MAGHAPSFEGGFVYVVDDDHSVRKGLRRLIRSVGLDPVLFASATDFLEYEELNGPGCVLLDVRMPGISGLDLQDEMAHRKIDLPIVFISGHASVPVSVRAMKAGAVDFIEKPFEEQDLLDALHGALARSREDMRRRAGREEAAALLSRLTPRETDVFRLVITGKLNKQIADDLGLSEKTVKVHRGRVMQKLGVTSVAELVRLAERCG